MKILIRLLKFAFIVISLVCICYVVFSIIIPAINYGFSFLEVIKNMFNELFDNIKILIRGIK